MAQQACCTPADLVHLLTMGVNGSLRGEAYKSTLLLIR
jgi:hypothetical protein